MAFHVVVLPRAQADIANAVEWLAERSPDAANRWRLGLLSKIEKLESDPYSFSLADESIDLDVEIRQLLFGRRRGVYRILFAIDGQTVYVLRVRHSAQDRLSESDMA